MRSPLSPPLTLGSLHTRFCTIRLINRLNIVVELEVRGAHHQLYRGGGIRVVVGQHHPLVLRPQSLVHVMRLDNNVDAVVEKQIFESKRMDNNC